MLFWVRYGAITNESLDPWNTKFSMEICDKHSTNCIRNTVLKSAITDMATAKLQGYA
jgi:hypothetical protein